MAALGIDAPIAPEPQARRDVADERERRLTRLAEVSDPAEFIAECMIGDGITFDQITAEAREAEIEMEVSRSQLKDAVVRRLAEDVVNGQPRDEALACAISLGLHVTARDLDREIKRVATAARADDLLDAAAAKGMGKTRLVDELLRDAAFRLALIRDARRDLRGSVRCPCVVTSHAPRCRPRSRRGVHASRRTRAPAGGSRGDDGGDPPEPPEPPALRLDGVEHATEGRTS